MGEAERCEPPERGPLVPRRGLASLGPPARDGDDPGERGGPGRLGRGHLRQGVVGGSARRLGPAGGQAHEQATADGLAPTKVVAEVGSGLNGHRTKLLGLLRDPAVGTIVVEHRDRLARFGVEYLEAALAAQGRSVVVVEEAEVAEHCSAEPTVVEVLTGFCARLYGRRSAKRRAQAALSATQSDVAA